MGQSQIRFLKEVLSSIMEDSIEDKEMICMVKAEDVQEYNSRGQHEYSIG